MTGSSLLHTMRKHCASLLLALLLVYSGASAQDTIKVCTVKNGQQYIWLTKNLPDSEIDAFVNQFSLEGLALKRFIREGFMDSILIAGWRVGLNNNAQFTLLKPLLSMNGEEELTLRLLFMEKEASLDARFPRVSNSLSFGYNQFRNKEPFYLNEDSTVIFYLRGYKNANKVMLAGSFNQWDPSNLYMKRTDSGWILPVKLLPGKYWYKFIVDGRWMIDNDNKVQENDGLGNTNSIFFVPNHVFTYVGGSGDRKVFVSGSFNNWFPGGLPLSKVNGHWELPVYLAEGTHTYRYIVNGKWMEDPGNKEHYPNEFGEYNSVIRIGNPQTFRLEGFQQANRVVLSGSFNNWRTDEIYMEKKNGGWEVKYVLGPGNHEYKFLADGKPDSSHTHSLILQPNFTFRLKGYEEARTVYLAGDFNKWSPTMLPMKKRGQEWVVDVNLSKGKHLYKFIVDGKWILDPQNKLWEDNEHETGNSVLWVD